MCWRALVFLRKICSPPPSRARDPATSIGFDGASRWARAAPVKVQRLHDYKIDGAASVTYRFLRGATTPHVRRALRSDAWHRGDIFLYK